MIKINNIESLSIEYYSLLALKISNVYHIKKLSNILFKKIINI